MARKYLIWGAASLLLAVVLGAFGAHGLKERLTVEDLAVWKTGVDYQFYHGFGILMLAAFGERLAVKQVRWVGRLFLGGILLFSGSLYVLSMKELIGLGAIAKLIGPVTPIGGLCFIAGWAILFINAFRRPVNG